MAITEKNFPVTLGVGTTKIYTCPAGKVAQLLGLRVTNKTTTAALLSVRLYDASADTLTELCFNIAIPAGYTTELASGRIVLEAGDYITASPNSGNTFAVVGSVAERS